MSKINCPELFSCFVCCKEQIGKFMWKKGGGDVRGSMSWRLALTHGDRHGQGNATSRNHSATGYLTFAGNLKFWQHAILDAARGAAGVSANWHLAVPTGTCSKVSRIAAERHALGKRKSYRHPCSCWAQRGRWRTLTWGRAKVPTGTAFVPIGTAWKVAYLRLFPCLPTCSTRIRCGEEKK